MEGFWGMGSTVSSFSTAKRLDIGAPGGGQGGKRQKGQNPELQAKTQLADRIEVNLTRLFEEARQILLQNRREVLTLAHALETQKTLTGEDVVAVLDRRRGPLVDGTIYADPAFVRQIEAYHRAAVAAHRGHSKLTLALPVAPDSVAVSWAPTPMPDGAWRGPAAEHDGDGSAPVEPEPA
jgi:hypothetical protein